MIKLVELENLKMDIEKQLKIFPENHMLAIELRAILSKLNCYIFDTKEVSDKSLL